MEPKERLQVLLNIWQWFRVSCNPDVERLIAIVTSCCQPAEATASIASGGPTSHVEPLHQHLRDVCMALRSMLR